jgi:tryptophanyl-tRNA synthetase
MKHKPLLISGIQPTGRLHLGNYLGALSNFVKIQNSEDYNPYFFVADYHSLTVNFSPEKKREEVRNLIRSYLKAGLNPGKSVIFVQSALSAHTELTWILATVTPYGELTRMTQFKEKSKENKNNINAGLFLYPVIMAADILLYDAERVPVGDDQLQHLELTREIARRFNKKFGETFVEPKPLMTETPRLMSLNNPENKMSKSSPKGCLFLDDSPEEIEKKIKSAVTDSGAEIKYNEDDKKAISNLMLIYTSLSNKPIKDIEKEFKGKGYGEFKKSLIDLLINTLEPFREKKYLDKEIEKIIEDGNNKARNVADKKLQEVKKKIGVGTT